MPVMSPREAQDAAAALDAAERSGVQIGLLSQKHPGMDLDDAYAVQDAWMAMKSEAGRRVIGRKIGLTSRAMQQALGIDTPDSGLLLDDMAFEDGAAVPFGRFIQPRVEAEIAFVMGRDLAGEAVTETEALDAAAWAVPALEILDTRILRADRETGQARRIADTIADNAANAGIVTGGRPMRPDALDLRWAGAIVSRDAVVEETGLAAGVLGHPARGLAWLARRLSARGEAIRAGEIVLSGSFIRPLECPPGTTITADFGPLGTVSCHFAAR